MIGFGYLGVREFPAVDPPIITVRTTYTGANADVIESQITEPLEESINSIFLSFHSEDAVNNSKAFSINGYSIGNGAWDFWLPYPSLYWDYSPGYKT